jgi:hypothetical protein
MTSINYYELVTKNPFNLEKIPKEFQTEEICTAAINKTWKIISLITNFTPEICNLIVDKNWMHLKLIPPEFRTEELCWKALLASKYAALPFVPIQTSDMCFCAINNVDFGFQWIREPTMEMCILAVSRCVANLRYLKESPYRDEIYMRAVSNNPKAFKYITNLTTEICTAAVNTCGSNLKYIPIEFQTLDLIKIASEKDKKFFKYVKHLTPEILNYIYEKCGVYSMCIINKELLTSEIILHSLELDIVEEGVYDLLKVFPEELKTKENCLKAFEKSNYSIYSMPNEFKTMEICMKAFEKYIDLEYFLPEFITYDICKICVEGYCLNITTIPDQFKTEEMYRIAVISDFTDGSVLTVIPDEIKTPELYDLAIQNTDGRAIQYITNPTQEQINLALELSDNDSFLVNYLGILLEVIPNDRLYTIIPPLEDECPICRESENEGSEWCKMNGCKTVQHAFHVKCVENWWNLDRSIRKCPMCRANAIEKV